MYEKAFKIRLPSNLTDAQRRGFIHAQAVAQALCENLADNGMSDDEGIEFVQGYVAGSQVQISILTLSALDYGEAIEVSRMIHETMDDIPELRGTVSFEPSKMKSKRRGSAS